MNIHNYNKSMGLEVSLCNYETGPVVADTIKGNKKVTISTINSIQAKFRHVYKLVLNDGWSMEAIMIPNMKLRLKARIIPEEWQDLNGEWADQDINGVGAQILLEADQANLFSHAVKDRTGSLLQVNQARLMQSEITGRYIIFGSCSRHKLRSRGKNTWVKSSQIQENEPCPSSEEVLISIMDSINLNEASNM